MLGGKKKKAVWKLSVLDCLKFTVDGAAKGKPGPAGICRVLRHIGGKIIMSFLSLVRFKESNEEKVHAIDKRLNFPKKGSQAV